MTVKINRGAQSPQAAGEDFAIEPPSKQFAKQGNAPVVVEDELGRKITLHRPNPVTRLNFYEAMGEAASSRLWAVTVMPMMFVTAIDDVAVSAPISKREILALYTRLDEEGMAAVVQGINENFGSGSSVDTAEAKK